MKKTMAQIYKEFEENQKKLKAEYKLQGMNEEEIKAIYNFDKHQLARDIAYLRRKQELNISNDDFDSESKNPLLNSFSDKLSVKMDMSIATRFWWIDEIESRHLLEKIKNLSESQILSLTLVVFEGYTQKEAAEIMQIPYRTFKYNYAKIKVF